MARVLAMTRAVEIAEERGLKADKGDFMRIAAGAWKAWKGDSASGQALAMRRAVSRELGSYELMTIGEESEADEVAKGMGGIGVVQAYVRAQYETTQYLMSKANIAPGGEMKMWRGIIVEKADVDAAAKQQVKGHTLLHNFRHKQNSLQSATTKIGVANSWQGAGKSRDIKNPVRVVLRMAVPREALFSLPVYGQNLKHEQEVVLAGLPWRNWEAWEKTAPTFESVSHRQEKDGNGKFMLEEEAVTEDEA